VPAVTKTQHGITPVLCQNFTLWRNLPIVPVRPNTGVHLPGASLPGESMPGESMPGESTTGSGFITIRIGFQPLTLTPSGIYS